MQSEEYTCPFCNEQSQERRPNERWWRCSNGHMWLPQDETAVKPEARITWPCPRCSQFRGTYRETLEHLATAHDDSRARRELKGIRAIVDAVRDAMQYDSEKLRRQRRSDAITEQEVEEFRAMLDETDTLDLN